MAQSAGHWIKAKSIVQATKKDSRIARRDSTKARWMSMNINSNKNCTMTRPLKHLGVGEPVLIAAKDNKWKPAKIASVSNTGPHSYNIVTLQGHYCHTILSYNTIIQYYHTILSYNTIIQYYHTILSYNTIIQYYHTILSYNTITGIENIQGI